MFLNNNQIESTYMKEAFGPNGKREVVLVIHMNDKVAEFGVDSHKDKTISENLAYLNNLAGQGFLDFNRVEIVTNSKPN